jgi:hypothetical protein
MKLATVILLFCIIHTATTWQFCVGICFQQNLLTKGTTIALEASLMNNLFLGTDGSNCTFTEGRCGSVFGVHIPMTSNINTLIPQYKNVQWLVDTTNDFYCFRNAQADAYLYLTSGSRCRSMATNGLCGMTYLYKSGQGCNKLFGWKLVMIDNNVVLQSVHNPNLYLFINKQGCVSGSNRCGSVNGFYFKAIEDIRSNNAYRGAFFNIPYQQLPPRT